MNLFPWSFFPIHGSIKNHDFCSLNTSFFSNLRLWASIALVPLVLLEVLMYICLILLFTASVFSSTFYIRRIRMNNQRAYLYVSLVFLHIFPEQLDISFIYHYILESLAFIMCYKSTYATRSTSYIRLYWFSIRRSRCGG